MRLTIFPPRRTPGQFPAVEFNYGLAPDVHLHIIAPLTYDREGSGSVQYGYGDTELGIKYRFVQETDYIPSRRKTKADFISHRGFVPSRSRVR